MRPDDRRIGVTRKDRLGLFEIAALLVLLGEGHDDVVVQDHDQADLAREFQ